MNRDYLKELLNREAEERKREEMELKITLLSQYSTSQLKAELRRRKERKK